MRAIDNRWRKGFEASIIPWERKLSMAHALAAEHNADALAIAWRIAATRENPVVMNLTHLQADNSTTLKGRA